MTKDDIQALIVKLKHGKDDLQDMSGDDLRGVLELDPEGPYHFVNLLKFKEKASYPVDHPMAAKNLTGQQAYNLYGIIATQQVIQRGGRLVQANRVIHPMGGSDWDSVATMEYQTTHAFFDMLADPDYQAALAHREAGLEATEVYVTRPLI